MAKPNIIVLPVPHKNIKVDPDELIVKKVKELHAALNGVKKAHDTFTKFPQNKNCIEVTDDDGNVVLDDDGNPELRDENTAEWSARVMKEMALQYERLEDEDDVEYELRVKELNLQDHFVTICYEFINKICSILGKPEVTEDEYEMVPVDKARKFCHDVLLAAHIDDPEATFFPRR